MDSCSEVWLQYDGYGPFEQLLFLLSLIVIHKFYIVTLLSFIIYVLTSDGRAISVLECFVEN